MFLLTFCPIKKKSASISSLTTLRTIDAPSKSKGTSLISIMVPLAFSITPETCLLTTILTPNIFLCQSSIRLSLDESSSDVIDTSLRMSETCLTSSIKFITSPLP